jgi:energy-coupling factor transporter ATP-binding protein EcfA2
MCKKFPESTEGRYSEIFRSSLQQLKTKSPDQVKKINELLVELFGVSVSKIEFDAEADEFVTVKYEQIQNEFDVVCSGAGLQQVIQMLTYLYLTQPRILLIDEPDAHLHSKLQAHLGELFRRVADDLDAQVFLSTHSLDLIDTFSTNEVLVIDSTKKIVSPIGSNSDLVSTLVDANIVDVSALSRLLSSRRLVVIEDEDQTILKAIDKAIGNPLFSTKSSSYVLSAKGVGNFRAIADLGKVLKGLTGTKFDLTFIQDRDGLPDFIVNSFLNSQKADGVVPHILERHEIESYLLEPALLLKAAELVGRRVTEAQATEAILKTAETVKAEARRKSRETAKNINRHLASDARRKDAELEVQVDKWFDNLDLKSIDVIQRVFPGKEMLQEVLKAVNDKASRQITRGHLVASLYPDAIAQDIRNLLLSVGKEA